MLKTPPKDPPPALAAFLIASSEATIGHLNVRKEGPDEAKVLAVDIKFEIRRLGWQVSIYFDEGLRNFLWNDDDAMCVRNARLNPLAFAHQLEGARVEIAGMSFVGDVKKFTIAPLDGGLVTLGCSVTIAPLPAEIAKLAKNVQDDVHIVIERAADLFDEKSSAAGAAERLDALAREHGTKAELRDSSGKTLITFGG